MKPLLENPSPHTAYMREWRARHPEQVAYQQAYHRAYISDPARAEAARQRARAWYEAHSDRAKDSVRRRQAREAGAAVGRVDRAQLLRDANGTCALCGGPLGTTWHFDHIVPLALGGAHSQENMQVTHPRCNLRKGPRTGLPEDK